MSLKTEVEAFPPVVFTYNVTACDGCKFGCRTKFDRVHITERKACRADCDKQEFCVVYSPVETKPDPVSVYTVNPVLARAALGAISSGALNETQLLAANNNATQALINLVTPAPKEYVGAEEKPADAATFFKKLQQYIEWKTVQDQKADNVTAPEYKEEDVLPQIPVVCVECVRKVMGPGETILAHITDLPRHNLTLPPPKKNETTPISNVTEAPVAAPPSVTVPIDNTKPAEGTTNSPIIDAPALNNF